MAKEKEDKKTEAKETQYGAEKKPKFGNKEEKPKFGGLK